MNKSEAKLLLDAVIKIIDNLKIDVNMVSYESIEIASLQLKLFKEEWFDKQPKSISSLNLASPYDLNALGIERNKKRPKYK